MLFHTNNSNVMIVLITFRICQHEEKAHKILI